MMIFTKSCLQTINDWQRGGNHKQKVKRGENLKREALVLPDKFRVCDVCCYRQEAHQKDRVWQLLADNKLSETIASWTTDISVAKAFKGGVPPQDLIGVIFSIKPPAASVILNLSAVYDSKEFGSAVDKFRNEIDRFHDGIGKYENSQLEVVLELESLTKAQVLSYGGYSSSRDRLRIDGRIPTQEELAEFDALCVEAGISLGPWWLSAEGTQKVLSRMDPHITRLKAKGPKS
jgi:hypothetical protein